MCRPFWKLHDWGLWIMARRYEVQYFTQINGVPIGEPWKSHEEGVQRRECKRCGLTKTRRVRL